MSHFHFVALQLAISYPHHFCFSASSIIPGSRPTPYVCLDSSPLSNRLTPPQYLVGSFACIGGGLFGLDISSMSGVLSVRIPPPWLADHPLTAQRPSRMRHTKGRSATQDPMRKVPLSHPCPQAPSLELSWSQSWQTFWEGGPRSWPLLGFGLSAPSSSVPRRTVECSSRVELFLEFRLASLRLVFLCTSPRSQTTTSEDEWFRCNSGLLHGRGELLIAFDCRSRLFFAGGFSSSTSSSSVAPTSMVWPPSASPGACK